MFFGWQKVNICDKTQSCAVVKNIGEKKAIFAIYLHLVGFRSY